MLIVKANKRGGRQPASSSLRGDRPQRSPFSGTELMCCGESSIYPNFSMAISLALTSCRYFRGVPASLRHPLWSVHSPLFLSQRFMLTNVYQLDAPVPGKETTQPVLPGWQVNIGRIFQILVMEARISYLIPLSGFP